MSHPASRAQHDTPLSRLRAQGRLTTGALLLFLLSALAYGGLSARPALADGVADEAELHFQIGVEHYREEDYRGALEHFLASHRLAPNRNVVYNIARCYERLGRLTSAYRYYTDALAGETDEAQIGRLRSALEGLAPRVAIIEVETQPAGAAIFLDRVDLGSVALAPRTLAVEPGAHIVLAQLEGFLGAQSEEIVAEVGASVRVTLTLAPILGSIRVEGDEGSQVRVDSRDAEPACIVPCAVEVRPGPHDVYVSAEGFAELVRPTVVVADRVVTLSATLTVLTGSIVVSGDDEGALVELNGRGAGFTPTVLHDVPVGTHRVRVSLSGYEPFETEVTVSHGEETRLDQVRLEPIRAVAAASRRLESLDDAPASVSVVSAAELEAFGYPTIYEALRGLRGVALTNDTAYTNASLRGIGQPNDYSNRLLLLSDGATLNDDVLYQAFIGYDARVDLLDVDHIELVRGPGSVLYGTGAVSGVVNLVPRSRDVRTHARFAASAADSSVGRLRAGMALRLGTDSGIEASIAGAYSSGRDVTLVFDADGDGVPERNTAHGAESFWAFSSTGRAWHEDLTVQWMFALRDQAIPTGLFDAAFDRSDNRYGDRRAMLELRYEPRVSEHVQLFTRVYVNHYHFDGVGFYASDAVDPVTGRRLETRYAEDYDSLWFGAEARVMWTPVSQLRVTGGIDVNHHPLVAMDIRQREVDGAITSFFEANRPFTVIAGYAVVDWAPLPELRFSAGARVDGWDLSEGLEDFVAASPRLAVIFHPTTMDTLKLMGGRAFRAPTTYEYFYTDGSSQAPSDCCGTRPTSEGFLSAELEYTHRFDSDWSLLAAAHGTLAEGFIETADAPVGSPFEGQIYYRNSTIAQYFVGGDLEVQRQFRGGWMFSAQYGYLEARYASTPEGAATDRVPNAPNHYAGVRAVMPFIERIVRGAFRATLVAPRGIDSATRDESEWGVVADFVISGEVADLGLRYQLGVYNLFDWRVGLPVSPFPARLLPQAGRSFLFSLELTI